MPRRLDTAIWDDDIPIAALTYEIRDVEQAAQEAGVEFFDIGEPLQGRADLVTGGIYPNAAGHEAIAEAVVASMSAA